MVRPLGGSWSAAIPGYFKSGETTHESGAHQYYWFGGPEVHFSRLVFKSDGAGVTAENMIHANSGGDEGSATFVFRPARTWLKAAAATRKTEDYWTVQAGFGISRGEEQDLLILTVIHDDHEEGALWVR